MLPKVSVIIASFNGRCFVRAAIESALSQSLQEIEVIVVDNCSTDGCYELVKGMTSDKRLRVYRTATNSGGPSVPRNRAIHEASGKWIAVMDNDDLMHPDRLRTLVDRAEAEDADIVADDLCIFDDRNSSTSRCLADDTAFWVDPVKYVRSNLFYSNEVPLGLLKPLIRSDWLATTRYRAKLHMAEDYDLIIRLLLRGARMKVYPDQMYFYRKHDASISHRLTKAKLLPPLRYNDALIGQNLTGSPALIDALRARRKDIELAIAYDDLVVAIKAKQMTKAICIGLRQPGAAKLLSQPVSVRARRLAAPLINLLQSCARWRAL